MGTKADDFIRRLASTHRVVTIGGLAVIAHGRNRSTKDADVWLEPFSSPREWAHRLCLFCEKFPGLTLHGLPGWKLLTRENLAESVDETGMIRINGLGFPLDIFRRPNEFEADDFDAGLDWCATHPDMVAEGYRFSKEAVIVWTMTQSAQLIQRGIRMNCTLPGAVQTPMLVEIEKVTPTAVIDQVAQPIGRRSFPDEQAEVLLFLNSPQAGYINGVALPVDGGFMASLAVR